MKYMLWGPLVLAGGLAAQGLTIPADQDPVTTRSGLKYSVLRAGREGPHPKVGDAVRVHYTGWLASGQMFASSRRANRPEHMVVGQVVKGLSEGLQLMTPGARFKFTIPPALAYGQRGRPPKIGPGKTLIFVVELLEVKKVPPFPAANRKAEKKTASGLRYEVRRAGQGHRPAATDVVELRYSVWLPDGRLLESSVLSGRSLKAPVKRMRYRFLEEIALLMAPGAQFRVAVPAKLANGKVDTVWLLELVRTLSPLPVPAFSLPPVARRHKTLSGLEYQVLKAGTGKSPGSHDTVTVHYAGWLTSGELFDSSFERGEPFTFEVDTVIQGWQEALKLMKEGAVYRVIVPGYLGYGSRGKPPRIGPFAALVFHLELLKVGK